MPGEKKPNQEEKSDNAIPVRKEFEEPSKRGTETPTPGEHTPGDDGGPHKTNNDD